MLDRVLDGDEPAAEAPRVLPALPQLPAGEAAAGEVAALRAPEPPAVLVAPPGPGAAQPRARPARTRALLRLGFLAVRWLWRAPGRGVTWAAVASICLLGIYFRGPLGHVGTILGVAAQVSVTAGNVVDGGLTAVVMAAQGVSSFAVKSTKHSVNVMDEAWRGIDLVNLSVRQRHAERVADDAETLLEWIEADFLGQQPPLPGADEIRRAVAAASVPHARESWQNLIWPGQYHEMHVTYDLLASGFFGIHVVSRDVEFEAKWWSNPMWELLDLDVRGEREEILRQLNDTLSALPLPSIKYVSLRDRELEAARVPGSWISLLRRLSLVVYINVKSVLQVLIFGP